MKYFLFPIIFAIAVFLNTRLAKSTHPKMQYIQGGSVKKANQLDILCVPIRNTDNFAHGMNQGIISKYCYIICVY